MALDLLDIDLSGTTDASGNLTISRIPSPAYWCSLKVIAQVAGNAIWIVQVNGRAVDFGRGARTNLGPVLVQPRDQLTIQVLEGQQLSPVQIKLLGIIAPTVGELLLNLSQVPNTIALDVAAPQQLIGSVSGTANQVVGPINFPVPPGTQSIGYLVHSDSGNDTPRNIQILGHQSNNAYASGVVASNQGGAQWYPFAVTDLSVDVTLSTNLASPSQVDILASPLVAALDVEQAFGTVLKTVITDAGGTPLTVDSPAVGVSLLGVSLADANPPPWLAAQSVVEIRANVANGANLSLITGTAGLRVWLHDFFISTDTAVTALEWQEDAGGTAFGAMRSSVAGALAWGSFKGAPRTTGQGIRLNNFSGGAVTLFGHLTYTKA